MSDEEKQVQELENELKVLKNEIKESLVGIREFLLTYPENPYKLDVEQGGATIVATTIATSPGAAAPWREAPPAPQYRIPEPDKAPEAEGARTGEPPVSTPPDPRPSVPADPAPARSGLSSATEGDSGMSATEPPGMSMEDLPIDQSQAVPPSNGHQSMKPVYADGDSRAPRPSLADMPFTAPPQPNGQADLATVAMLAPWLEDCLPRLGRTRVRALVKLYADMGGLAPECKSMILQLIELDGGHAPPKTKATLQESLRVLTELDAIITRSRYDRTGAAILAVYLNSMARPAEGRATPQV